LTKNSLLNIVTQYS
jgi:hypothetical protein